MALDSEGFLSTGQLLREGAAGGGGGKDAAEENRHWKTSRKLGRKKIRGYGKGRGWVAVSGVLEENVVYVKNRKR